MKAIDLLGHVAITGKTGYEVQAEYRFFKHCVEFEFDFDTEQLVKALNNKVISKFIS